MKRSSGFLVAGGLAALGLAVAGVDDARPTAPVQEVGAAPAVAYSDSSRVDSLRARITPDRLAELRREAAEGGPRDWYDLGAALLLTGDWEGAVEPLERAVATANRAGIETAASYNLGVAHGVGSRPPDRPIDLGRSSSEALRAGLMRARDAFRRVLRADPAAEDARWNLEVVSRWLDQVGGGGGGGNGQGGGDETQSGERREMTPEEVQRLLDAAASEERRVQEDRFERSRSRDPVAERNW